MPNTPVESVIVSSPVAGRGGASCFARTRSLLRRPAPGVSSPSASRRLRGGLVLSKFREPVNGLTHLGGAVASAVGLVVLVVLAADDAAKAASLALYGVTLILMFSASAAYHLAPAGPRILGVLRKLDHVAIYLLIAGTYTPVCLHYLTGFWRLGLAALAWAPALIGAAGKLGV